MYKCRILKSILKWIPLSLLYLSWNSVWPLSVTNNYLSRNSDYSSFVLFFNFLNDIIILLLVSLTCVCNTKGHNPDSLLHSMFPQPPRQPVVLTLYLKYRFGERDTNSDTQGQSTPPVTSIPRVPVRSDAAKTDLACSYLPSLGQTHPFLPTIIKAFPTFCCQPPTSSPHCNCLSWKRIQNKRQVQLGDSVTYLRHVTCRYVQML